MRHHDRRLGGSNSPSHRGLQDRLQLSRLHHGPQSYLLLLQHQPASGPTGLATAVAVPEHAAKHADVEPFVELRCLCMKTVSGIHPSNIQNLEVLRAGPHCANVEVIATLKNRNKVCLDPEAPKIKKIVQKILESSGSMA
ncbi:platelet basic protein-like isoform X2 [Puma concolor]|uniref:C-X-C motif chemokine n=1 Tax=Puma concolor TaxID=9696 RepID=A0A6P6HP18_PUMCO|nr:platelet basic protein-like isoform X2 [Puma concolor]